MGLPHVETMTGPVAVGGRTINLVARTRAITAGRAPGHVLAAWSRPLHVEVLDADGRREIVKVRDYHRFAMTAIAGVAVACVLAARVTGSKR